MKRRRVIIAIAVGALLLGGLVAYWSVPKEPSYQGRKLSWWIKLYEQRQKTLVVTKPEPGLAEPKDAIRAMGPKAIPTLLKWIQMRDTPRLSPFKRKVNALLSKQRIISFRFEQPYIYGIWSMAAMGLGVLGNEAMPAVPTLTRLLDSPSENQRIIAFTAILMIAEDKKVLLPVITESLKRQDNLRMRAALYIHQTHPEQEEALGVYNVVPYLRPAKTNRVSTNEISLKSE